MKRNAAILCLLLVLSMLLSPLCLAAGSNTDTLADWHVVVTVPDGATAALKGSSYYIYAKKAGAIPYVMLCTYHYDSEETFIKDFTEYMKKQYSDLKVTAPAARKTVGDLNCWEIDYTYKVNGYNVKDRRIVVNVNGTTYMFASKEIESRGDTVGNMLEEVIESCVFLDENGNPIKNRTDGEEEAVAYLYRTEDGMPKYWLDFSGGMADNLVLHCWFRSGDPTFYEKCFILDMGTAKISDDESAIRILKVYDMQGNDCSNWFKQLSIKVMDEALVMTVRRNESTLAGGTESTILTGVYSMTPMSAGIVYEYYQKDGMRKYWLTTSEDKSDLLLHAMFRSGEPGFHEEIFTLDLDTAVEDGDYSFRIAKVYSENGADVSRWFKSLTLTEVQGAILMNVRRNESTLAGGADDNILTGTYQLEPRTYLLPLKQGPYSADELGEWAQIYYFTRNGFYPPEAEVEKNKDGTFTIHLYEVVELDGITHTATSAWYTVDAYGKGFNSITEEAVNLFG